MHDTIHPGSGQAPVADDGAQERADQCDLDEINFSDALWTIPKERMKRRNPHLVFLSRQALDIFIALKTFAGGSDYVLPSRYDSDLPMSSATLNQVLTLTYRLAQKEGKSLAKFGPHDLRRTASTLLHEAGYNTDWIAKCLAHEQRGVRAVYNKAEYREQRTAMLQSPKEDAAPQESNRTV